MRFIFGYFSFLTFSPLMLFCVKVKGFRELYIMDWWVCGYLCNSYLQMFMDVSLLIFNCVSSVIWTEFLIIFLVNFYELSLFNHMRVLFLLVNLLSRLANNSFKIVSINLMKSSNYYRASINKKNLRKKYYHNYIIIGLSFVMQRSGKSKPI